MIPTLNQTRATIQQADALKRAASLLNPKLKALLNPHIVDTWIRITLHINNGDLAYVHDADGQPGYTHALLESEPDAEYCQSILTSALKTIRSRLEGKLGRGWHGKIILLVTICAGQATISSEADGVHKLG